MCIRDSSGGVRGHIQGGILAIQGRLDRRVFPWEGDDPRPGGRLDRRVIPWDGDDPRPGDRHYRPGRRAPAPPSILAIRAERLQKEKRVNQQDEERQRDIWDRQMRRRQASPEARRSGRKRLELSLERCSSRSRSSGGCERLARSETSMLSGVTWRHHIGTLNPDPELIANHARAAIRSWTGLTEAGSTLFYVGVSRYLRRRWLGGDALSFEQAHSSKWCPGGLVGPSASP